LMLRASPPHDPAEAIPVNSSRHSACSDCHNSHAAQPVTGAPPTPPTLEATLQGTSGLSAVDGTTVLRPAVNQFEICFKCHADSKTKPQSAGGTYIAYGPTPYRVSYASLGDPYNARLEFQSATTRHNVTQPSRGTVSPSLRANMLDLNGNSTGRPLQGPGLYLYCTDCHNNDQARISGGTGPDGPHGSDFYHLLERQFQYDQPPAAPGGVTSGPLYASGLAGPYAMCDKCHNLDGNLLANTTNSLTSTNDSVFHLHYEHVVSDHAACSTCHSSHGVQNGNSVNNGNLVDFDTRIVGPDANTGKLYIDTGAQVCYLTCHGQDHNGVAY